MYINGGTFNMTGGSITNNTGFGVYLAGGNYTNNGEGSVLGNLPGDTSPQ